jgi:hypothetical protein
MSSELGSYLRIFALNEYEGRLLYANDFGRPVDDPAIDDELQAILEASLDDDEASTIAVPEHLLLAIVMRVQRKRQPHRPRNTEYKNMHLEVMAIEASDLWRKLVSQGMQSKAARVTAASQTIAEHPIVNVTPETLMPMMRLR